MPAERVGNRPGEPPRPDDPRKKPARPLLEHFESFAEKQIREAIERGEFDDLPGTGKPMAGLGRAYDPAWWARSLVLRESARARADEVRQLLRDELPRLRAAADRTAAEARLAELNGMVDAVNALLPPVERIPAPSL